MSNINQYPESMLYSHWTEVPEWIWDLCPNFHPSVDRMMVSPDTGAIRIHIPSLLALQQMRDILGPLRVLSGYRSPVYNARVKGAAPLSQHKVNIAWDLAQGPYSYLKMVGAGIESGFKGLGIYPTRKFIHVDMGPSRYFFGTKSDRLLYEAMLNPEYIL